MSDGRKFARIELERILKDRNAILSDVNQLYQGDSAGLCLVNKNSDGRILPEEERLAILLNEKLDELSAVDIRITDFCRNFDLANPLVKKSV